VLATALSSHSCWLPDELGRTVLYVVAEDGTVEVLESMLRLAKLDAKKRNILDIADNALCRPLHRMAQRHPDPAAIKLLVSHHPQALLAKDKFGNTPLDCTIMLNKFPAVVSLVRELTAARRSTIALRTMLLLCIKHGYVGANASALRPSRSTFRSRLRC